MFGFLKELWTTMPPLLKLLLLPMLFGAGWLGFRLTAPPAQMRAQMIARSGQLEQLLAAPLERASGSLGVLYSKLRGRLIELHKIGRYGDISQSLHAALTPKPPFAPAFSPSLVRIFQMMREARPTSIKALGLTQFPVLLESLKGRVPMVKRRPHMCVDATQLEPKTQCLSGIAASIWLSSQYSSFQRSLPGLIWPLLPGTFACGVGRRKFSGKPAHGHGGVDFGAKPGTPLWAMADGVVTSVNRGPINPKIQKCGYLIKIRYDNGYSSTYCHMLKPSSLAVKTRVRQGQLVGLVGSTGNSTDPHLHLVVWKKTLSGKYKRLQDPIRDAILCR